ncbi:hypothetical protein HYH03_013354 [Edaphochlamys debaryana]|uniref:SEP domain-containing protein n=1 Tax=Edaphochlamys debaryana TaxID=47281 RepID=A0A836BUL3_9CHLO|nr:hypothetical protein HYH03_013354 [Edaphochlamys debaryana]|eukprot:KAG2488049.1 hypothetical protein HYH03_013354 [Edaphochlamys debaryana]
MAEHLYRKRIAPTPSPTNVDDLVSKNVLAQLRRDPPPRPPAAHHAPGAYDGASRPSAGPGGPSSANNGVEGADLIASMAKRLAALERDMKERGKLLEQVQADNTSLKGKLRVAEEEIAKRALAAIEPRGGGGGEGGDASAVMHLRSENSRLRAQLKYAWKQVAEMKGFLNDYGLVWVGEPEAEEQLARHGFGPTGAPHVSPAMASSGAGADGGQPSRPVRPSRVAGGAAGAAAAGEGAGRVVSAGAGPSPAPPLSSEASDVLRRKSHSGAAAGPSSAAAAGAGAGAAAAGLHKPAAAAERSRSLGPAAPGLSAAASAALGRAGDGPSAHAAAAAAPPREEAKRVQAFAAPAPAPAPAPSTSQPAPSSALPPANYGSSPAASSSLSSLKQGLPFSMQALMEKVDELNDLAEDGCGHIVSGGNGQHVLATRDAVNLVVYRDGLQIHTLPAKPFSDPATNAVLRDILDGYFPYVLKRDFPDGVPLRVVDRTHESIENSPMRRAGAAGGVGASGAGNIRSFGDIEVNAGAGDPESRDKFLSRLPQAVIKNGKVIEIRGDVSRMLGGGHGAADGGHKADNVSLIATPVDALLSTIQRNHVGPSLPPPSREGLVPATEVSTLQVKSMDGKQTYILKLKYDDTIGALRACINAHLAKAGQAGSKYEIRSAFPATAYADEKLTLRKAGLVPNATLFLRPIA